MDEKPLVSICTTAYNHEKYIRDAIEGFLMQKTNFTYEILINDDASTDSTASIIREYEQKYPHIIKPTYQKDNQYSKGVRPMAELVMPRARGKYIALCEGDDYWTDSLKLQKQVDFLDNNFECSFCFTDFKTIKSRTGESSEVLYSGKENIIELNDFLRNSIFIIPCSIMFRSEYRRIPEEFMKFSFGDLPLKYYLATKGKIGYVKGITAVYRKNSNASSWTARNNNIESFNRVSAENFELLNVVNEYTEGKYSKSIRVAIKRKRVQHLIGLLDNSSFFNALKLYFENIKYFNIRKSISYFKKMLF